MELNLVFFEQDSLSQEVVINYVNEFDDVVVSKTFDNYDDGIRYVKKNQINTVLFSMLANEESSYKYLKRLSKLGVNVIVLSEKYTTSNIIKVLRAGAKDFVSKPVIKKELYNAFKKCMKSDVKVLEKSHVISVFSNKGGVGKTAIATNLAVEMARLTREKVLLLDLNLPLGDVATFLDIHPSVSIADLVSKNPEIIFDACKKYKDLSLYVLAEPIYVDKNPIIKPTDIKKLLDCLKTKFSYIIVDLGISVDKFNLSILENSDEILLVTVVNLPLIRNCQRCLDLFANLKFSKNRIKVVINRYLDNDEISQQDVENALNKKIYWKIPNNYYTMMSSINKGIPVGEVSQHSNVTESFSHLASKLSDDMLKDELDKK